MANRFQSVLEGVVATVVADLRELHPKIPAAHWLAKDGQLIAIIDGKENTLIFEAGDPITDALLLFLNHNHHILTILEQK